MQNYTIYALISMLFAGFTSVIAKLGLQDISSELGLAVRTCFVFGFVVIFTILVVPKEQLAMLSRSNFSWLALSAATTTASWVFYYKALKLGDVSQVALIDKGSFVVAVLFAWLILNEKPSMQVMLGCSLILTGLFVVAQK